VQPADLARQGHFGLMGMRERALLYGGQLTITSAPGQGAAITARLPLLH
jgi:signal transduction histidine kinase